MRIAIAFVCGAAALAATLAASTIDVSSNSSQQLQTGDSLEFLFSAASYASIATQLGIAPYPDSIDFVFSSLPVSASGDFTAEIESFSGTASASFGAPLYWTNGYSQSSQYTGVTSAIVGTLDLSAAESQAFFSSPYADLILTYSGPPITVGVSGYTLPNDLTVSLEGASMSVGGMVYTAGYESASGDGAEDEFQPSTALNNALVFAPEPGSRLLFIAGIGLCMFAGLLKRLGPDRARQVTPRG